jgi:hypothetical protein
MIAEGIHSAEDVWSWAETLSCNDPEAIRHVMQFDSRDVRCHIFGHVCPVFVIASEATETKETRKWGRHIPNHIMLAVARRDNNICQICTKVIKDYDIHFAHRIPYSHGGPTSVNNIRVVCGKCNRKKSNSLSEIQRD